MDFDFERCLHPTTPSDFLNRYWEREPLHVRRQDPGYYHSLLSLRDADAILHQRYWDPRRVVVANQAKRKANTRLPSLVGPDGGLSTSQALAAYDEGNTLILNSLHQDWPPLAEFARDVTRFFHCPVGVNAYLTPPRGQGFPSHFDTHDVLVLQTHGSKRWRLFHTAVELPLPDSQRPLSEDEIGLPTQEVELREGDLLYLPRGLVHDAVTGEEASLHLTVGVHVFRWIELLRQALDLAAQQRVELRRSLPPSFLADEAVDDHETQVRRLLASLGDEISLPNLKDRLRQRFLSQLRPLPDGHMTELDHVHEIAAETQMGRRPGMPCAVWVDGEKVSIAFPGNVVTGPLYIEAALRFLAGRETFRVSDLHAHLDPESTLVLVRRLVREGLLRRREGPDTTALGDQSFPSLSL